jgi:hypothetical protein
MKKLLTIAIPCLLVLSLGCFLEDDSSSGEDAGTGILEVTVNYNGVAPGIEFGDDAGGTAINYVILYKDLGPRSDSYPVKYEGSSDTNGGTITITGIKGGSYYVVVFYDYDDQNEEPKFAKNDPYSIYDGSTPDGSPYVLDAQTLDIPDDETTTFTMDFDDTWDLGTGDGGRCFLTP